MSTLALRPGRNWPAVVDLVVFDFDGVMTDNTVLVFDDGHEAVRCHRGDGLGVAMLLAAGFAAMVLSTEVNPVVSARAAKLHLPAVQGSAEKGETLATLLDRDGIDPARVVYLGNDVNDLSCLRMVGLPVVVADAAPQAADEAALVLTRRGGDGAVRELCDMIVRLSVPGRGPGRTVTAGVAGDLGSSGAVNLPAFSVDG